MIELLLADAAVDVRRRDAHLPECLHLVFHQRDQRRNDDRHARQQQCRDLIAHRFPAPVGMTASTSLPERMASIACFCPARNALCPKYCCNSASGCIMFPVRPLSPAASHPPASQFFSCRLQQQHTGIFAAHDPGNFMHTPFRFQHHNMSLRSRPLGLLFDHQMLVCHNGDLDKWSRRAPAAAVPLPGVSCRSSAPPCR